MITSRVFAELVFIYFPNVFFAAFPQNSDDEQESGFPDIEQYAMQLNNNWALDIKRMSAQKIFLCFFSSDAEKLSDASWNEINSRLCNEKPSGGLSRPFTELEDDKYISVINKASGHNFIRDNIFSVPQNFFNILDNFDIKAFYNYDKKTFTWDFSRIIRQFHPDSIIEAFQRYAHHQYTIISFGVKKSPLEKNIIKLIKFGNEKILDELGEKIDWDQVGDALQVFPHKDPYQLSVFDEVKKDVLGQMKRYKDMGYKDMGYNKIFDHNDEVNISNAWNDLLPLIKKKAVSEKEKNEYKYAGLVMKVQLLFNLTLDKESREIIKNIRRINTIKDLYSKLLISKADDPIANIESDKKLYNEWFIGKEDDPDVTGINNNEEVFDENK
ncbi:MAG: hypothetical protein FWB77_04655 [Treponema sp.]|nr:hypothetical protein [Treponema sp.]